MNLRQLVFLILAWLVLAAPAYETPAPAEIIRQLGGLAQRRWELERREREITADLRDQLWAMRSREGILAKPYNEKEVADLTRRVESEEEEVARRRAELAAARVASAEERQARSRDAEAELKQARAIERSLLVDPFEAEDAALKAEEESVAGLLGGRVSALLRQPAELGIVTARVASRSGCGMVRVGWHGAEGQRLASLEVVFAARFEQDALSAELAGDFPIHELGDDRIVLRIGSSRATFEAAPSVGGGKAVILERVGRLVDLVALRDLEATVVKDPDLMARVVKGRKVAADLWARKQAAAKPNRAWQRLIEGQLTEYGRPYDPKRVANLERDLADAERRLYTARQELFFAALAEPQRADEKAKAAAEVTRLNQALQEVVLPLRPEQVALEKESRYVQFALWDLAVHVALTPQDAGVTEASADVGLGLARIHWRDARGQLVAFAELCLLVKPDAAPELAGLATTNPAQASKDMAACFWVGGAYVRFTVSAPEWQGREKVQELAKKLLDLAAIAAWTAVDDGNQ